MARRDDERAPSARLLHDRARESASELRRLLLGLASGGVGVTYLSLSGSSTPPLTVLQRVFAASGLVLLAGCVLAGVIQWRADVKRNYAWARALETEGKESAGWDAARQRWVGVRRRAGRALRLTFVLGMLGMVGYALARILGA